MSATVILVSPKGSANVGSVARLMMNFGLRDLRIVEPRCELDNDEARMMSLKARPILQEAQIFSSLSEAQRDVHMSFAFSMVIADDGRPIVPSNEIFSEARYTNLLRSAESKIAFVFGREDSGLNKEEINLCDVQVLIPSSEDYPSLNLSHSVAICLYSYSRFLNDLDVKIPKRIEGGRPQKIDEEIFFEGLEKALDELKFFSSKNPSHVMRDLKNLYHRAQASDRELRILFGIVAELEYRLGKKFFRS